MSNVLWFLAVACIVVLLFSGLTGAVSVYVYLTVQNRRPEDASAEQIATPVTVQPLLDTLGSLGFRRVGESRTRLALPAVTAIAWILVDAEGTTQAEVVANPPMLALTTVYGDEAVVETGYPIGERIDTPSFRSTAVTQSIATAYRHHLEEVADFGAARGAPQRIESIADYFRWDRSYRLHHARQKMQRLFVLNGVLPMAAAIYTLVVGAYSFAAGWWAGGLETRMSQLMLLLAPALLITGTRWFLAMVGSGRKTPG